MSTAPIFSDDAQARRRALEIDTSFIVQAPAGSGKTSLLVQRYLALLSRVAAPEEILAITFTRKAAAEMRARVIDALHLAAGGMPCTDAYQEATRLLAERVLLQDRTQGWQLLEIPTRLRIQTIDAFCAALVNQAPLSAGVGMGSAVTAQAEALYQQAAERTLQWLDSEEKAWSEAIQRLLRHLDNDVPRFLQRLALLLSRRDQWLRHIFRHHSAERRHFLESALNAVVSDTLQQLDALFPMTERDELMELLAFAAENCRAEANNTTIAAWEQSSTWPAQQLSAWRAICAFLITQDGTWRLRLDKSTGMPAPAQANHPQQAARRQEMKARAAALVERLQSHDDLRVALAVVPLLPKNGYDEEQWKILEALIQVLSLAAAQLNQVFEERGEVDFVAMAQAALRVLGESDQPSDVLLQWDYRLQHILVDEFQDTSLGQWQLLERLVAGWQVGDGRTLFLVGDPMQSIYRFRQAEVGLFLRAQAEGIGAVTLQSLILTANFRARANLIAWINHAGAKIFPAKANRDLGAVTYTGSQAQRPAGPESAVHVHALPGALPDSEAEHVAMLVSQALHQQPQGSIAILLRARAHAAPIIAALRRTGVAYHAVDIDHLGQHPAVQDAVIITRALLHPADRIAWLALLRAPWCGLLLEDLITLVEHADEDSVWQLLLDEARLQTLSVDGQRRCLQVRKVMEGALAQYGRTSLRDLVHAVWLSLCGDASLDTAARENVEHYLDIVETLEEGGTLRDFSVLEERLADLYATPGYGVGQSVQLMTIHRAKGLEFDTVILPGLGRRTGGETRALMGWWERATDDPASSLVLAPIGATGADGDPVQEYLRYIEQQQTQHETARVLYVALTRARETLHLVGQIASDAQGKLLAPPRGTLWHVLWPVVADHCVAAHLPAPIPVPQVSVGRMLTRLPITGERLPELPDVRWLPGHSKIMHSPEAIEFSWVGEATRCIGTVVHYYLWRIHRTGIAEWDTERVQQEGSALYKMLRENGVPLAMLEEAVMRVQVALKNVLQSERGRWVLQHHAQDHSEYGLSGVMGGRLVNVVIDRTFVDAQGVRWIIDYKTGVHAGGGLQEFLDSEQQRYRSQLELYASLMTQLEPRAIRLGLYFPLLEAWRSWDYEP